MDGSPGHSAKEKKPVTTKQRLQDSASYKLPKVAKLFLEIENRMVVSRGLGVWNWKLFNGYIVSVSQYERFGHLHNNVNTPDPTALHT